MVKYVSKKYILIETGYQNVFLTDNSIFNLNGIRNMTEDEYKEYYKKTIEPCWENELNKELKKEYGKLNLCVRDEIKKDLSCPLLIFPGLNYKVGEGIFIIGQNTHGWGHKDVGFDFLSFENPPVGIDKEKTLMVAQADWFMYNYQYYIDSDFHNAVKAITGIATGKGFLESPFVWDDLIAVDYKGISYKEIKNSSKECDENEKNMEKIVEYSRNKLRGELFLAKPKLAIFFTGGYGDCFYTIFEKNVEVKNFRNVEDFSDLNHFILSLNGFSIECYATYHPSYLKWKKKNKQDVMRKLAEIVKEAQK